MVNKMKIEASHFNSFWSWFQGVYEMLPTDKNILNLLDQKITDLGNFDWEIGPGQSEKYFLAISPNRDKSLISLTREIIEKAPICPGWEFLYAKPPKNWNLIWKMYDEKNKQIEINAQSWQYVLYQFNDGTFDVVIKADNLSGHSENTKLLAVEIALEGILGEERFLMSIEDYELVSEFDAELKKNAHLR